MKKSLISYELVLTNTLSGAKEKFVSIDPKRVTMYVCGITPYDYAHIGHGRCYVLFDVLYRLLKLLGYEVAYCRNFTDIDDKLINRAQHEHNDPTKYLDIASFYINAYHADMKALNCLSPNYEPRVTEHMPEIIAFIEGLLAAGKAYNSDGDIYYSIESFSQYGKLSKRDISELCAGARVQVREDKRNPLDFALWKKTQEPGWQSPWGFGRPGWHIECSALADKYLGTTLDIHAGGMDLIFPHHENEIAQSEGLHNKPFARYWLHNAFVRINKEKMSKSLGNFVTLHDIYTKYNPMVIRYYFLTHHYRNPLDFSPEDIESASKSYQKLSKFFDSRAARELHEIKLDQMPLVSSLIQALCDDVNIAKFFGIIFDNLKELQADAIQAGVIKTLLQQTLGLTMQPLAEQEITITPEIQELLVAREQARKDKNWQLADTLRDKLRQLGFEVQDKKL